MKKTRKLLCLIMVLAVMSTLTATALAENERVDPGIDRAFMPVSYNTEVSNNRVVSYMTLGGNPYNGIIRITHEAQATEHTYPAISGQSKKGALSYTLSTALPYIVDYPPTTVYVAYEVYGSQEDVKQPTIYRYYDISVGG